MYKVLSVSIFLFLFNSAVRLSDTPTVSSHRTPTGGVSQQHPHASAVFVTAEQVQNLPVHGSPARLQHLWWNDKGETCGHLQSEPSGTHMNELNVKATSVNSSFMNLAWFKCVCVCLIRSLFHLRALEYVNCFSSTVSWGGLCRHEEGRPPECICRGPPQDARRGEVSCDLGLCKHFSSARLSFHHFS